MRLKEDTSNWRASNVKRKLAQAPEHPTYQNKKDRKRWCGGKEGRDHDWQLGTPPNHSWRAHYRCNICTRCGRQDTAYSQWWSAELQEWVSWDEYWQHREQRRL